MNASHPPEHAHSASGPVVWVAIIGVTCLLLLVFQKVLWLVVPFLLALILYYFLYPAVRSLIFRGMSRDAAASVVTLAFLVLLALAVVSLMPRLTSQVSHWQNTVDRYVQGGTQLLDASLRSLERHWSTLERAKLADTVAARLNQGAGNISDHIEPVALGIMAWTPSLLLAPFLAFFFLRDGRRFKRFLSAAVPNAFFERTLYLLHEIDRTARAYFQGLINLTILDTVTLAAGLWLLGIPGPLTLGVICAVLAWVPYVGSILGGLLVVLVAATDFPNDPAMAYWAIGLFGLVRLLDDFLYMPLTIGKSLELHPLVTVLMIFVGGAVAGVSGLMLVLPVLGVVMVVGETIGMIVTDSRLMARHRHARKLLREQVSSDL
ncbi:AI-2E family transporter [Sulfuritalea sp.]|uniref:AI-2E family transporter n=1 Tax=Sulfuritalea sp. TaxID=2480090 RepID=UPI0025EF4AD3|nr:AI-2E family transporter [Sulfuritalea sp.]